MSSLLYRVKRAMRVDHALALPDADTSDDYRRKLQRETDIYKDVVNINVLPDIFHYWSHRYLKPMLDEYEITSFEQFFARSLLESAERVSADNPVFISVGVGNCETEVAVARLMVQAGLKDFTIECLDINPHMLARGKALAEKEGVAEHLAFVEGDFNRWAPQKTYAGAMANQSLHHVLNLEGLFDGLRKALPADGYLVMHDMIGRNGHMRWPEAYESVSAFWSELPLAYRYNRLLKRQEKVYVNWDCSNEGFEGIRAQDIVPLLLERFHPRLFIGFANVIDPFIDRAFGHNFDANAEWDRSFIDRIHQFDEEAFQSGRLSPTHMVAIMSGASCSNPRFSRGIGPATCIRSA
ncbi:MULTISPECIES: class I SAM-dependent methyltransferase [Dyella]|nr:MULTISPECIES: class I SAM-dependent methyltransferase [Dyella]